MLIYIFKSGDDNTKAMQVLYSHTLARVESFSLHLQHTTTTLLAQSDR